MKTKIKLLITAGILGTALASQGAVIVTEDFTYSDGALAGNNGGTGDWSSAWAGDGEVSSGQNNMVLSNFGNREFSTSFTGSATDPLYFSALFTKTGTDTTYAQWIAISDNSSINSTAAKIGLANDEFSLRLHGAADESGDFGSYTPGQTVQIVGKLEFNVDGTNERLQIWVDPTDEETALTVSAQITGQDLGWVTPTHAITGNFVLDTDSGLIDNIRVGTSWADVGPVAIPESSSTALLGLGGLALALRRRRS